MKKAKPILVSYDYFLDPLLIKKINAFVDQMEVEHKPVWRTCHGWHEKVKRETSPIAILELPDHLAIPIHKRLRQVPELSWKDDRIPRRPLYYLCPPGGYTGWHNDGKYEFASMIFLNPVWNLDWGGLHLYDDLKGLGIRAEVPTFNKCIINGIAMKGTCKNSNSAVVEDPLLEMAKSDLDINSATLSAKSNILHSTFFSL